MNYLDQLALKIRAEVPKADLPDEDTQSLFRTYAVLLLAKGVAVTPADVHNAWVAWMVAQEPDHESIVPFEELSASVVQQDQPYVEAIVRVAEAV